MEFIAKPCVPLHHFGNTHMATTQRFPILPVPLMVGLLPRSRCIKTAEHLCDTCTLLVHLEPSIRVASTSTA